MATVCDIPAPAEAIKFGTWLRFLIGSREAILRIARCRQALWLGLVFVLSTGFAREYDGADLWHDPWHLALPLVASLGTSLVLWTLVYLAATSHGLPELPFWVGYRTLLTFYWMTAPLAWLYAIPVERLMTPGDAAAANLWFLAVVSVWRVLLITRALSVWLSARYVVMFFLVMLFADSVALALAFFSPMPIFNFMGGIRHSAVDRTVLDAMINIRILGTLSWPVWAIAAVIALVVAKSPWSLTAEPSLASRVAKPLWGVAAILLVLGIVLLPIGQPEQRHAYEAERLLNANELDAAVEYMLQFPREAFPPIWDPPPRIGYGELTPQVAHVLAAIERHDAQAWLREIYVDKLKLDPTRLLQNAVPRGDDENSKPFDDALSAIEKYIPANSLDEMERADLQDLSKSDRVEVYLRNRVQTYLYSDGNQD